LVSTRAGLLAFLGNTLAACLLPGMAERASLRRVRPLAVRPLPRLAGR
jgi:hypothetical protein